MTARKDGHFTAGGISFFGLLVVARQLPATLHFYSEVSIMTEKELDELYEKLDMAIIVLGWIAFFAFVIVEFDLY